MPEAIHTRRRQLMMGGGAMLAAGLLPRSAFAADALKVGLIVPMSGPFASTGRQIEAAVNLYQQKYGDTVAGRKVEILLKDDGGLSPDVTKRLAQEMVARDKVRVLAGFGLTPLALAAAPIATQAKVPMIVMAAATSIIPQRSPFIVHTGVTLPQVTAPLANWAARNKIRNVVTFVSDYAPFLQRVKDTRPEALFVFVPSGEGAAVLKQFTERGLAAAGIRLICTGDVLDDDLMVSIDNASAGVISSHHYSAAHPSPANMEYVEGIARASKGRHTCQFPFRRRLRWHTLAVRSIEKNQRRQRRRKTHRGHERHELEKCAWSGRMQRHATWCRTSTSARQNSAATRFTLSNSTRPRS